MKLSNTNKVSEHVELSNVQKLEKLLDAVQKYQKDNEEDLKNDMDKTTKILEIETKIKELADYPDTITEIEVTELKSKFEAIGGSVDFDEQKEDVGGDENKKEKKNIFSRLSNKAKIAIGATTAIIATMLLVLLLSGGGNSTNNGWKSTPTPKDPTEQPTNPNPTSTDPNTTNLDNINKTADELLEEIKKIKSTKKTESNESILIR